jgi:hypothetical protein
MFHHNYSGDCQDNAPAIYPGQSGLNYNRDVFSCQPVNLVSDKSSDINQGWSFYEVNPLNIQ